MCLWIIQSLPVINKDACLICRHYADVHVGFKLPVGKRRYKSKEDKGYVEICLVLLNESQGVINTAVNVTLTPVRTNSSIFVRGEKW